MKLRKMRIDKGEEEDYDQYENEEVRDEGKLNDKTLMKFQLKMKMTVMRGKRKEKTLMKMKVRIM